MALLACPVGDTPALGCGFRWSGGYGLPNMDTPPLDPTLGPNPEPLRKKRRNTGESSGGPTRPRTRLNALKAQVKVRGLAVLDRRTLAARHLLDWRGTLVNDLGGAERVTAALLALVEDAARTRLYLDHVDAFLMEQPSLIVRRRRLRGRLIPLVLERMRIADHLTKVLTTLGLERRAPKPLELGQYLAQNYGERDSAVPPDTAGEPAP